MTDTSPTATEPATEDAVREYVFKIVIVGDYNVGKTTLLQRLLTTRFHHEADSLTGSEDDDDTVTSDAVGATAPVVVPTIGVDFYSRVLHRVRPRLDLRLQLWDTAGLEQYAAVDAGTYRHASVLLCVFDVTHGESLRRLLHHHLATAAEHLPELAQSSIFVVGNKIDLRAPDARAARTQNDRRSRHPEAAFVDLDTATDLCSSATNDATSDTGTTRKQRVDDAEVHKTLLHDLPEVHYAEVSARCGTGVASLLEELVHYLLQTQIDTAPTSHTALVPNVDSPTRAVAGVTASANASTAAATDSAVTGSWRHTGVSFDLTRPSTTAVVAAAAQVCPSDVSSPLYSPQEATHTATPRVDAQDTDTRADKERRELLSRRHTHPSGTNDATTGGAVTTTERPDTTTVVPASVVTEGHDTGADVVLEHAAPAPCVNVTDIHEDDADAFRQRIQNSYAAIETRRTTTRQDAARNGAATHGPPPVNVAAQYRKEKQKCHCRCHK